MKASKSGIEFFFVIKLAAALFFMFGLQFIPPPDGLTRIGMNILGIFIGTIILWIFVAVDWPNILCLVALSFSKVVNYQAVLAGSLGSWLTMFLASSFMLSYAMSECGFSRRVAIWGITRPIAQKNSFAFLALFLFGPILIGSVMSPTTVILIFLPIANEIFSQLGYEKGDPFPQMVVLGLAFSSTISSSMTPIAHAWPIMAISLLEKSTGVSINFLSYMAFGVITGLVVFAAMVLMFKFIYKPDLSRLKNLNVARFSDSLKPMDTREKATACIFGLVVIMWILPSLLEFIAPETGKKLSAYGVTVPPMIGVAIMSVLRIGGKPLLNFSEAVMKGVSWPGIFLAATAMIVSQVLVLPEAGLVDFLVTHISPVVGSIHPVLFLLFIFTWCIFQTNFSADTVAVSVSFSIAVPIAMTMTGVLNPMALTACIGAGAGFAYATPPAGGPTNVVAASGWVNLKDMAKWGILLAIVYVFITLLVGYPLANLFMKI
jgi:sodium-dependent dicarboxylate transporter 2/3/5